MFERYTERARRVLFFARYEASQLGSISIETEHLLLGLIREGKGLTSRIFANQPERSEEHTSELQSRRDLVCRLLLEKKKKKKTHKTYRVKKKVNDVKPTTIM